MEIGTLILLIIIGFAAGFVGGLIGVGGGIVVIPALVILLGMTQGQAQGTNLAMMIPPIGILAAYNYWKNDMVNIKFALILAATFIIGGYLGSKVSVQIPQVTLKKVFSILLIIVAIKMFFGK
jgi:uncharacterized membrane protein YfcA